MKNDNLPKTVLFLGGGFGNNLFQYAAGLYFAGDSRLLLETGYAGDRNKFEFSFLERIQLRENVVCQNSNKLNFLTTKIFNLLIKRSSIKSNQYWRISFNSMLTVFASLYFSAYYQRLTRVVIESSNILEKRVKPNANYLIVGYFQTDWYLRMLNQKVSSECAIRFKPLSSQEIKIVEETLSSDPIVIHQRLGDYLSESGIGCLSTKYFYDLIIRMNEIEPGRTFLVLSDEIDRAEREWGVLNPPNNLNLIFSDQSANVAFNILRGCRQLVISNSSFSWWAARTAEFDNQIVYAPSPWFKTLIYREDLYQEKWVLSEAIWRQDD